MRGFVLVLFSFLFVAQSVSAQELKCGDERIKSSVMDWIKKDIMRTSWGSFLISRNRTAYLRLYDSHSSYRKLQALEARRNFLLETIPEVGRVCSEKFKKEMESVTRGHPLAAYCGRYSGVDMTHHVLREEKEKPALLEKFKNTELLNWIKANVISLIVEYEKVVDDIDRLEYQIDKDTKEISSKASSDPALRSVTLGDIRTTLLNKEIGRLECVANFRDLHRDFGSFEREIEYKVSITDEGKYYLSVTPF